MIKFKSFFFPPKLQSQFGKTFNEVINFLNFGVSQLEVSILEF